MARLLSQYGERITTALSVREGRRTFFGTEALGHNTTETHVIISTYSSGTLKMFTSHVKQSMQPGGRPEYVMTHLNSWALTGNIGSFQ